MIILIICWLISRFLTDNKMVVEQDTSTTDVFIKSSDKPAEFRSSVDIPIPKSSILSSSKSSVLSSLETPKKKVSFLSLVTANDLLLPPPFFPRKQKSRRGLPLPSPFLS